MCSPGFHADRWEDRADNREIVGCICFRSTLDGCAGLSFTLELRNRFSWTVAQRRQPPTRLGNGRQMVGVLSWVMTQWRPDTMMIFSFSNQKTIDSTVGTFVIDLILDNFCTFGTSDQMTKVSCQFFFCQSHWEHQVQVGNICYPLQSAKTKILYKG